MTIGYGYGLSITPIQLCSVYASLVNNGQLIQPTFIKKEGKIQDMIDKKKPVYNLKVDMKKSKFEGGEELVVSKIDELPSYIKNNMDKYKKWLE